MESNVNVALLVSLIGVASLAVAVVNTVAVRYATLKRRQRRRATEERLRELGEDRAAVEGHLMELRSRVRAVESTRQTRQRALSDPSPSLDIDRTQEEVGELSAAIAWLESEIRRTEAQLDSMPEPSTSADIARFVAERQERRDLQERLAEYERVVPFEVESQRAKRSSTFAFLCGVLIVLVVLGVALRDWWEHEDVETLTTGTGLARLGAVLAAFYVAGQLFKRSTALQIRAQEFERAAIAMKVTPDLSEQLSDTDARDQFVMQVYASHLTSPSGGESGSGNDSSKLDVSAIIDGYNKLRSGGA